MGAKLGTGGGFTSEPNVIPMIDILLVLLIIFMMQIPLQRKKMDIQLPPVQEAQQQPQEEAASNQIVLELTEDGGYAINSDPVAKPLLERRLREIYDPRPVKLMFLKTARNRRYNEVVEAMDVARSAGVQVIGFTPPEGG
ncbi:MAG: biopolymer transporter ExbD [Gemmatimonadota bacterium]|nr:biopolymer transporter ExbD [Gemmatimonadota bacterium]